MSERIDFEKDTDDLLDRALASYTPVMPRLGLEDRVRVQLSVSAQQSRRSVVFPWAWAVAGAFTAAIILGIVLRSHATHSPQSNARTQAKSSVIANAPESENPKKAPPRHRYLIEHSRNLHTYPHQPTQQELIAQLLADSPEAVALLAQMPEAQQQPIEIQPLAIKPLEIEPIKIKPIDNNSAESGGAL